ncbi:hypothetical protein O988_00325 [Pseudogymnoascus sp. VKM F-3808]|nr:hypothetical protein O988_00325 [Pseudogymnoascus sp. VKM F-3808]
MIGEASKKSTLNIKCGQQRRARTACIFCRKAHIACGNERPCKQCTKRGLSNICRDAPRQCSPQKFGNQLHVSADLTPSNNILHQKTLWPVSARLKPRVNPFLRPAMDPCLAQTVESVNPNRPLPDGPQQLPFVSLTSIMLPNAPVYSFKYRLLHIKAYVDTFSQDKIIFKLTSGSMKALIKYHEDVYFAGFAGNIQLEDHMAIKRPHEDFIEAVHGFVHEANRVALEELEKDGSGEMFSTESEEAKNNIMKMLRPMAETVIGPYLFTYALSEDPGPLSSDKTSLSRTNPVSTPRRPTSSDEHQRRV